MRRLGWIELLLAGALGLPGPRAAADEPPVIEHQPQPCTLPDRPFSLCAKVSDDVQVAKARVYFRRAGEKFYSFVDMTFEGLRYCATLPAPRQGQVKLVEYYLQAADSAYQAQRTSTFQIQVQPPESCEFPPVESDPRKTSAIVVFATHQKQGRRLPDGFLETGVRFVPVAAKD